MPGGIAHLGGHLSNPRYGYAIFQHDPSVERSRSTGVGTIAALKACPTSLSVFWKKIANGRVAIARTTANNRCKKWN
jgi:hypothetical protein